MWEVESGTSGDELAQELAKDFEQQDKERESGDADRSTAAEPIYGVEQGPETISNVPSDAPTRPATEKENRAVRRIMEEAETTRELKFIRPVEVYVQNEEGMADFVRSQIDPTDARHAFDRYRTLGLITNDYTFDDMMDEASKAPLLGYYDPKSKRLVLKTEVAYGLAHRVSRAQQVEWRAVVLHELVHALQDQHFDLQAGMKRPRSTDQRHAFMALVEGDATLSMMHYYAARAGIEFDTLIQDVDAFDHLMNGAAPIGSGALAPPIKENPGLFRYRAGVLFAAAAVGAGSYSDIDKAFRRPPKTTHEILEPDRYFSKWSSARVRLPKLAVLAEAGYRVAHEDTLGRIEASAFLRQGGPAADAASSRWEGDRVRVYRKGKERAVLWVMAFDDPGDAKRAATLAKDAFDTMVDRDDVSRSAGHLAYHYIQYAVIARNVPERYHPRIRAEMQAWIDRGRISR